jgi:thiosulfate dehydrogenase [quinone] large subunit
MVMKNYSRRTALRTAFIASLAALSAKFAPTASAAPGKQIIRLNKVKVGGTFTFTHSAQGVPAIGFRTKAGVFAYSTICTHQGCAVKYKSSSKLLVCPCHGATFDPASNGKVVSGQADAPLPKVKVAVKGAWIVEA